MNKINEQIHTLTIEGINEIRKQVESKGAIDIAEDDNWSALYVNDDGYAELAYYRKIELETNGKLNVLLSDGIWLYEDSLTTVHVMDILTIIEEGHEKHTK